MGLWLEAADFVSAGEEKNQRIGGGVTSRGKKKIKGGLDTREREIKGRRGHSPANRGTMAER